MVLYVTWQQTMAYGVHGMLRYSVIWLSLGWRLILISIIEYKISNIANSMFQEALRRRLEDTKGIGEEKTVSDSCW